MAEGNVTPRVWVTVTVLVAVIGCIGVIIAAVIGIWPDIAEPETPTVVAPQATSTVIATNAPNATASATLQPSPTTRPTPIPPTITPLLTDTPTPTPNPWAGIIDISLDGLEVIKGYDLWFSSLAGNRWQIWHLDSQSGNVQRILFEMDMRTQLLDQFVPAISPDGSRIAFAVGTCVESGHCDRDLYLANVDGTNVQRLTSHECLDEYHPSWSPDGKLLAYFAGIWNDPECPNTTHGIWVMDLSNEQTRQLTDQGDYDPVWSPNGRYLAYHSATPSWDVKVLNYESCGSVVNSCTTWVAANIGNLATSAGWLNDNAIVFTSDADGDWEIYQVAIIPNQTLVPSKVTDNNWDDQYPALSTDGRILVWQAFPYYSEGDIGAEAGKAAVIHVMNLDKGEETPLITGIGNARDGFLKPRP